MQQQNLLTAFEYKEYGMNDEKRKFPISEGLPEQEPQMELNIDFKSGKLSIDADWKYILHLDQVTNGKSLTRHTKRVHLQMDVSSSGIIDLNNDINDGLLMTLEGSIDDNNKRNYCTGILLLESKPGLKGAIKMWYLAFYIFDSFSGYREISFNLPLYTMSSLQVN